VKNGREEARTKLPLVLSATALAVAVLGTTPLAAIAQNAVFPRNSVGTVQLKRNAVTPAKLAPNAVRTGHVLNGSLLVADFKPGQIPQGPKGDKGDKGERGEQGIAGLSDYQIVSVESTRDSLPFRAAEAVCPGGKRVLGGGVHLGPLPSTTPYPYVQASYPNPTGNGWRVEAIVAPLGAFTAYAICARVS
jgi:hypothetical protein